jgi:protein transport protein HofB
MSDLFHTAPVSQNVLIQCLRHRTIPVAIGAEQLTVASERMLTAEQETALRFACNKNILTVIWPASKLEHALQTLNGEQSGGILQRAAQHYELQENSRHYFSAENDDEPVVKFINQTLADALRLRASDIHFEPFGERYRIRFRIDGVLQEITEPPPILAARLTARLKVLGKLDIAERRLPQDGQITLQEQQREYAIRISTLPVIGGEKIVLRIIAAGGQTLDVALRGMPDGERQNYLQALNEPQGLILVTGPTGSGKTATMYGGLNAVNQIGRNICSVEDPIEVPLCGINQAQVNLKSGLTFSRTLRAFLRQDPDIIMIGEIRDAETAEIAVNAAQTGHLVLSTLHTNSAVEALIRLEQMGVPAHLVASALRLVIAQRLVRRLCPRCKQQGQSISIDDSLSGQTTVTDWQAIGCGHCLNGYYGRSGIYQVLNITADIKQAILNKASVNVLVQLAIGQGAQTLMSAGLALVKQGVTSLEEIYRTVGRDLSQLGSKSLGGEH